MIKGDVWLLAACQALMMTGNTLLVTTSALVGYSLAVNKSLATLPLALQFLATMAAAIPASLIMASIGRRSGFVLGSMLGIAGASVASYAILHNSFVLFCAGVMMIGAFNGFGNYYRFAAVDVVALEFKSRAISYVMAGGVVAALAGPNLARISQNWVASAEFAGSYLSMISLYVFTVVILGFTKIPRPHEEVVRGEARPLLTIIRQPVFIVALTGAMLGYGIMSLVMTATPLSMHHHHHDFSSTSFVISWHVLGMFAPSFFTGHLIRRFGVLTIMLAGAILFIVTVVVNLSGTSLWHYWFALLCLGIGWNFLFIGGTDLLTEAYLPSEKARTQAVNDFMLFATVGLASLSAGYLQDKFGWQTVNYGVVPLILIIVVAVLTLAWMRHRMPVDSL